MCNKYTSYMVDYRKLLKNANIVGKKRKRKHIMFQMLMPYQYIHEENLLQLPSFRASWSFAADGSAIKITINACHIAGVFSYEFTKKNKYRNPNNSISVVPTRMSSMNSSHSKRWKIRFVLSPYIHICKGLRKIIRYIYWN